MIARARYFTRSPWGRTGLLLLTAVLPVYLACTSAQDTEPFVPALPGAQQPVATGSVISEDEACERLLEAAIEAYGALECEVELELENAECPTFIRPAGASGCYEYSEQSVEECESTYAAATACSNVAPCFATAIENTSLPTCVLVDVPGEGGAPGSEGGAPGSEGGAPGSEGGAPGSEGGAPGSSGAPPQAGAGGQLATAGAGGAAP